MKKVTLIVPIGLVVLLGAASCSSASAPPLADVTGFASARGPALAGSSLYRPVTVRVVGADARMLAQLVNQLPPVAQSQVHCEEPLGLVYRIAFRAGSVAPSREVVTGYECAAAVTVAVAGKPISWRQDASCALIRAVRHLLPARAKATQSLTIGCAS
jgi:hypothetical protein